MQLNAQWLTIMVARHVSLWLPHLEISTIAKHGFPRLGYSDGLDERSACNQCLFARAGSQRSCQMNILQANTAALVIWELMIALSTFHSALVLAEAVFRTVFGVNSWHVEISVMICIRGLLKLRLASKRSRRPQNADLVWAHFENRVPIYAGVGSLAFHITARGSHFSILL